MLDGRNGTSIYQSRPKTVCNIFLSLNKSVPSILECFNCQKALSLVCCRGNLLNWIACRWVELIRNQGRQQYWLPKFVPYVWKHFYQTPYLSIYSGSNPGMIRHCGKLLIYKVFRNFEQLCTSISKYLIDVAHRLNNVCHVSEILTLENILAYACTSTYLSMHRLKCGWQNFYRFGAVYHISFQYRLYLSISV